MDATTTSPDPARAARSELPHANETFRLSRHVCIRPAGEGFLVESARTGRSMVLTSPSVFRLLLALSRPVRVGDLLDGVETGQRPAVLEFLRRCRDDGMLARVDADGRSEEETGSLAHWEFHDLLFHVRSRRGRNPAPVGATYPLRGHVPPEPAFRKAGLPENAIHLTRPDLARLCREDPPLARVMETRRTRYRTAPMTEAELGELLFRTCRVTDSWKGADGEAFARRPYPSGGSLHSLEVYVVVADCDGVERGLYRYHPGEHALAPVRGWCAEVEDLLSEARAGTGTALPSLPPALLVVTARMRRVAWKYQSIAYRLVLQEVGALYQTLYLAATAMGLAPCAIGAGDSDRFARVSGVDHDDEPSVGEFILGGRE